MHLQVNASNAFIEASRTGTGSFLPLAFNTSGVERLRIDTDGSIYVNYAQGVTSGVAGGIRFGGAGSGEGITSNRGAGSNQYGLDFTTGGGATVRLSIANGGTVTVASTLVANTVDAAGFRHTNGQTLMGYTGNGGGETLYYAGGPNGYRWVNSANSVQLASLSLAAAFRVEGSISAASGITGTQINGTTNLISNGYIYCRGSHYWIGPADNGWIRFRGDVTAQVDNALSWSFPTLGVGMLAHVQPYVISVPNIANASGQILANAHVGSSLRCPSRPRAPRRAHTRAGRGHR